MSKIPIFGSISYVANPKKILIFSTAYYPFVGGAEVAIKEITDRIPDVQFDLITAKLKSGLPKTERVGNVNVHRLGIGIPLIDKLVLPFWGALKAIGLNNKNRYDFFWCMMASFGSGAAYIANILKFWRPTPTILTLQEGDSEKHFKYRWLGLIDLSWRLALQNTKILTAISSYLSERVKRLGYRGRVEIIPNGVDIENFDIELSEEERVKIRQGLGLEEKDLALATTSRLSVKNGLEYVIKALPKLSQNIKFVIFGEGRLRPELEKLAKNLEVSDRVIFKGYVSHDKLPKYLKACDIFIRPALSEGMGNSFLEAMAGKLPVIATPVGGIVDFLVDPAKRERSGVEAQTGYFCQPDNAGSIVDTVKRVITDPNKNQVIDNAFKMVREKYDWNLITEQMKKVFG